MENNSSDLNEHIINWMKNNTGTNSTKTTQNESEIQNESGTIHNSESFIFLLHSAQK